MTRWPLLALALIACALTFAACGGDDGGKESSDAAAVLAQTFDKEKDVRSGRLDMNLKVDTDTPATVRLSGPFEQTKQGAMPRFDFEIAVEAAATSSGSARSRPATRASCASATRRTR